MLVAISSRVSDAQIDAFIEAALHEDIGDGDHTALACIPESATGQAQLLVKDQGVLAGVEMARRILQKVDADLQMEVFLEDGSRIQAGDVAFLVKGKSRSILQAERLLLNVMQRMSGIASLTQQYVDAIQGLSTKLLDTRKTTPQLRFLEKWAVLLGGGHNYRWGLYDRIMIKDNHIDFCGGVQQAIDKVQIYLAEKQLDLAITVEVRDFEELEKVLAHGQVHRIMLDNFRPDGVREALDRIAGRYETEASGGITLETLRSYAETGVDFISVGALTHSFKSLDLSLKKQ